MLKNISIEVINSLTLSEMDVLKFVENNMREVLELSIHGLSKRIYVSTATIMRLCKKLGFEGFSELKFFIKENYTRQSDKAEVVSVEEILNNSVLNIKNTAESLNTSNIEAVVDLLMQSLDVHFFGKGLTSTVLEYASKQLLTMNRSNHNYVDTHIAYLSAENMTQNSLLIVASLSGFTHQIVRMAQIAKTHGAKVVTITQNGSCELSKIGDINFSTYASGKIDSDVDYSSRLSILLLLDTIITRYHNKKCVKEI